MGGALEEGGGAGGGNMTILVKRRESIFCVRSREGKKNVMITRCKRGGK